ncbi:MAG: efflux RND transporter periplasmic adaptor subunit [Verrucomicrobiales bacterium]|nr:efflux RND transporter periplasmic adaptor subunit [Verrucomicrobiales bacterium]
MKKYRKPAFWALIGLLVAGFVHFGLKPKAVNVDTMVIKTGSLMVTVDEDGETMVKNPYVISAPLAGRLLRVTLEPGDPVSKETTVAEIDAVAPGLLDARAESEARARIGVAEANVKKLTTEKERLVAEVEKWQRYAERDAGRLAGGHISSPVLKDTNHSLRVAQINLDAGVAAVDAANYELELAKSALQYSRSGDAEQNFLIKSPVSGVVLQRFLESSKIVSPGEEILEVGDPGDLEVQLDVLSQDAVKIKPGQRMIVERWGGDESLSAIVRRIEPSAFTKVSALGIDEQRVYVYADFDGSVKKAGNLGNGYRVEGRIVVSEKENAVLVPEGALFRKGDDWAVYIVDRNKAEIRILDIGMNNGIEAEVLSGLSEGDIVVLHPGDRVEEGSLLECREL